MTYKELAEKYLTEEEKEDFIENLKVNADLETLDDRDFISEGFLWDNSPQGFDYLSNLEDRVWEHPDFK